MKEKKLSVQVGKRYWNRNGSEIEIVSFSEATGIYSGKPNGATFNLDFLSDGRYADRLEMKYHSLDLVKEIERSLAV